MSADLKWAQEMTPFLPRRSPREARGGGPTLRRVGGTQPWGKGSGLGAGGLFRVLGLCSSLCDGGRRRPSVSAPTLETQVCWLCHPASERASRARWDGRRAQTLIYSLGKHLRGSRVVPGPPVQCARRAGSPPAQSLPSPCRCHGGGSQLIMGVPDINQIIADANSKHYNPTTV